MSDLRPATEGYAHRYRINGDWQTGLACPDCGNEMVFCHYKSAPGYPPGGINAFCMDESHPIIQVSPDGTVLRANAS